MNNIQKAFLNKSRLRKMADGGAVDPSLLGDGLAARAGFALKNRRAQLDAAIDGEPAPAPAPAPADNTKQPEPEQKSALRKFFGLVDGGPVRGKGGPRDDAIGPVALSNGEFVLPADTVNIVGRDKLEALRLATHKFTDTDSDDNDGDERVQKMADGGSTAFDIKNPRMQQALIDAARKREAVRAARAAPAAATATAEGVRGTAQRGVGAVKSLFTPSAEVAASRAGNSILRKAGFEAFDPGLRGTAQRINRAAQVIPKERVLAGRTGLAAKLSGGGGRLGGAARGGLALAPALGVLQTLDDNASGFTDEFASSVGAESDFGRSSARVLQSLTNAGDAATFGLAGRLGRGIAGALPGGEGFFKGFGSDSQRTEFENRARAEEDAAAARPGGVQPGGVQPGGVQPGGVQPGGVQPGDSLPVLSQKDRISALRSDTSDPNVGTLNFGNSQLGGARGGPNIFGSASVPGGRIDTFTGIGTPSAPQQQQAEASPLDQAILAAVQRLNGGGRRSGGGGGGDSSARAINDRFDSILRGGFGQNVRFGSDFADRHRLDIETARNDALDRVAGNQNVRRGQDLTAETAGRSADLQALSTLRGFASDNSAAQKAVAETQQRAEAAQRNAVRLARGDEATGVDRLTNSINGFFNTGDDAVDKGKQEEFKSFVFGSDPQVLQNFAGVNSFEALANLPAQSQEKALQRFKTLFEIRDVRNAAANKGVFNSGATVNNIDDTLPERIQESTVSDVFNSTLSPVDYLRTNLPFNNKNVVIDRSGQPTPVEDILRTANGGLSAERLALLQEFTGQNADGTPVNKQRTRRGN